MVIAIIGASGLVGVALTEILTDKLQNCKFVLFGNESAGQKLCYFGKTYIVQSMEKLTQYKIDYAMFMATESVAKQYIPLLVEKGVVCIDNSSAFRMNDNVPLVVPQINGNHIGRGKLIANPNCTTIQVVIALHALLSLQPRHITVATYQAVSGAGKKALLDLEEKHTYGKLKSFSHPIFDNVIAQIGEVLPDGTTTEEQKMRNECKKILGLPLSVNSFCVRVPVTVGHGAFVNVKFEKPFNLEQVRQLLCAEKDVILLDDAPKTIPMPTVLRHTHIVGVGRISQDESDGLNMFVVADNLLRGAAYNAYQILQICMKNNGDNLCN